VPKAIHLVQSSKQKSGHPSKVAGINLKSASVMKSFNHRKYERGKVGWALLWLIGVPIPVLLIFFLMRGCT
jgi:hypothetical protein